MKDEVLRYRVNVKSLKWYPAVSTDGYLTQEVTFHVKPLDNGIEFDVDGGVVGGETLKRCLRLQERKYIVVELSTTMAARQPSNWRLEIVNAALEEAAKGA